MVTELSTIKNQSSYVSRTLQERTEPSTLQKQTPNNGSNSYRTKKVQLTILEINT